MCFNHSIISILFSWKNGLDCEVDESVKSNRLLTFDQIHTDTHATYDEIRAEANMQRCTIYYFVFFFLQLVNSTSIRIYLQIAKL